MGNLIKNRVTQLFSEEQIIVHTDLEQFSICLRAPGCHNKIFLIIASTQKDLFDILLLKNFLNDRHLILIVPDTAKETMSQAYKLYPRYISDIQGDFKDVILVLEKMITKAQKQKEGEQKWQRL